MALSVILIMMKGTQARNGEIKRPRRLIRSLGTPSSTIFKRITCSAVNPSFERRKFRFQAQVHSEGKQSAIAYSDREQEEHQNQHGFETNDLPDELTRAQDCELAGLIFGLNVLMGDEKLNEMKASSWFVWLQILIISKLALEKYQNNSYYDEQNSENVKIVFKSKRV